ncbi:MAG: hypothetical protein CMH34_14450 [Microbacterium sp.]|nr:hypothetical protein [Microbacterium sp.]
MGTNENKASTEDVDHVAVGIGVIGGHDIGHEPTESASPGATEVSNAGGDVGDVASIVAQVRSDAGDAPRDEIAATLRERLAQAGQELSDGEVDRLVSQVTTGGE